MSRLIDQIAPELPHGLCARPVDGDAVYLYDESGQPGVPVRSVAEAVEFIASWMATVDDGNRERE